MVTHSIQESLKVFSSLSIIARVRKLLLNDLESLKFQRENVAFDILNTGKNLSSVHTGLKH